MRYPFIIIFFACLCSCNQPAATQPPLSDDPKEILKNFSSWWNYTYTRVDLSTDFTAIDGNGTTISKESFLEQLRTGNYIAINKGSQLSLYPLQGITDKDIINAAKSVGEEAYLHYKMEGTPLPGSGFTDINGKQYNKASLAGKILVLKCWFINCVPCVQEMPALNEVVNKYKNRNDIVFLSLAIDTKPDLEKFLQKTKFDYGVVAGQANYMSNDLRVAAYPTHFIVNRSGNIAKMTSRYDQMLAALEKEIKIQK